jgi:uncharacterized Zn-finger protein
MDAPHSPVETILIDGHRVMCDGGGGALGHPKVWYELGEEGQVECGYCGRVFITRGGPSDRPDAPMPRDAGQTA